MPTISVVIETPRPPLRSSNTRSTAKRSGRPYHNRFVSIVTVKDGKVTRWRDYLDPVAVFDAAGWPEGYP